MLGRNLSGNPAARACLLVKTLLETRDDDPLRRSDEQKMREVEAMGQRDTSVADPSVKVAGQAPSYP